MPAALVLTSSAGPVTTVTLNRPDRRNALGGAVLEQLCAAIADADTRPHPRILVLRGAGPVFCAGLDLVEAADSTRAESSAALMARALQLLSGSRLVTIAVVQGAAIAGGAGLMSACDFVIAADDTKIGYPEVRRGLVAGLVMTFLRRQLREREVRELLLTGELVSASRAREIGLVNRVVPAAELEAETARLVASVLAGAPQAITHTKALLASLWPRTVTEDLEQAHRFHLLARNSPDGQEGMAAFREKRTPRWAPKPDRPVG